MSEERVMETVRANSAAMNSRVMNQYADTFTEDAVTEGDMFPAPVVGPEANAQSMAGFFTAFPDMHFEVEREFASGDQAAVCWRVTGTHRGDFQGIPPTGRRVDYHASGIFQMRDGKIARAWVYLDTGTILRQLGVLPGDDQAQDAGPATA